MSDTKQLTLPVTGMTCANCVATVERSLKKLDGVATAVVNLSSERATVEFDSAKLGLTELIARIGRAGYGVATGEADLVIRRLSDDNDARRLEKALARLEGVLEAQVTFTTEKARVKYVPTVTSQNEIRRAVSAAGFEALELGGETEDAEARAREREINEQRRLLSLGLIFPCLCSCSRWARTFPCCRNFSTSPVTMRWPFRWVECTPCSPGSTG